MIANKLKMKLLCKIMDVHREGLLDIIFVYNFAPGKRI